MINPIFESLTRGMSENQLRSSLYGCLNEMKGAQLDSALDTLVSFRNSDGVPPKLSQPNILTKNPPPVTPKCIVYGVSYSWVSFSHLVGTPDHQLRQNAREALSDTKLKDYLEALADKHGIKPSIEYLVTLPDNEKESLSRRIYDKSFNEVRKESLSS